MSLLEVADELYALPLGDFTATRDARAKQLKRDDAELAARVKALRKPSLAAWVVDLLVRRDADQVDQVLAVGAALREAQESMSGDDLRSLTRQRRQLTAAVTTRARALASDEGQRVTGAVAEQVEATLTAAMLDADCGRALRSGLLVAALTASGLGDRPAEIAVALAVPEALGFEAPSRPADAVPEPVRPDLRVVPDPEADAKARRAAQEAVDEAQRVLDAAVAAQQEADEAVSTLEADGMRVQARIEEIRRELAELESEAEDLEDRLGEAEEAAEAAVTDVTEAAAARDAAAGALARLPDSG